MAEIAAKRIASLRRVFLQNPLFAGIDWELCDRLFDDAQLRTFAKGEQIYKKQSLSFLLQGSARVLSEDGCMVMRRMQAGDFYGAANLFSAGSDIGNILACSSGIVADLSEDRLRRLLRESPQFAENYIAFLSGRIRFLNDKIHSLTGKTAEDRLLRLLQSYAEPDGRIILPFSMLELANRLHIGRSSLYRAIDQLIAANQIERKNHILYRKGDTL